MLKLKENKVFRHKRTLMGLTDTLLLSINRSIVLELMANEINLDSLQEGIR